MRTGDSNADAIYHDPIAVPEETALAQLEIFERQMRAWAAEGVDNLAKVGALSMWYLSVAAGTFAELRYLG